MLATPSNYEVMDGRVKFLGLIMKEFVFCASILQKEFPSTSIAYPCWDHCGRTSLRNLMNKRIQIVAEIIPNTMASASDGFAKYLITTVQDLKALKKFYPNSTVRQADITPHVRQNCDATVRVLSNTTLEELSKYLPCAKATYL